MLNMVKVKMKNSIKNMVVLEVSQLNWKVLIRNKLIPKIQNYINKLTQ